MSLNSFCFTIICLIVPGKYGINKYSYVGRALENPVMVVKILLLEYLYNLSDPDGLVDFKHIKELCYLTSVVQ